MPIVDVPPETPAQSGVCSPWATVDDICEDTTAMNDARLADALEMASTVLFNLTKRRWPGVCSDEVWPCGTSGRFFWRFPGEATSTCGFAPRPCGCDSSRACGCARPSEIRLPGNPIVSIDSVHIDGELIEPARYQVHDRRWLVWIPDPDDPRGRRGWPMWQDMTKTVADAHTFRVAYTFGRGPDRGGVLACAEYAYQIALGCTPATAGKCRLPRRVSTVTRGSTTIAVLDPMTLIEKGMTGLAEVDQWVAAINLGDSRRRGRVFTVGKSRGVRRKQ